MQLPKILALVVAALLTCGSPAGADGPSGPLGQEFLSGLRGYRDFGPGQAFAPAVLALGAGEDQQPQVVDGLVHLSVVDSLSVTVDEGMEGRVATFIQTVGAKGAGRRDFLLRAPVDDDDREVLLRTVRKKTESRFVLVLGYRIKTRENELIPVFSRSDHGLAAPIFVLKPERLGDTLGGLAVFDRLLKTVAVSRELWQETIAIRDQALRFAIIRDVLACSYGGRLGGAPIGVRVGYAAVLHQAADGGASVDRLRALLLVSDYDQEREVLIASSGEDLAWLPRMAGDPDMGTAETALRAATRERVLPLLGPSAVDLVIAYLERREEWSPVGVDAVRRILSSAGRVGPIVSSQASGLIRNLTQARSNGSSTVVSAMDKVRLFDDLRRAVPNLMEVVRGLPIGESDSLRVWLLAVGGKTVEDKNLLRELQRDLGFE